MTQLRLAGDRLARPDSRAGRASDLANVTTVRRSDMAKTLEQRVALLEGRCNAEFSRQIGDAFALEIFAQAVLLELAEREANPAAFVRAFIARLRACLEAQKRPEYGDEAWLEAY